MHKGLQYLDRAVACRKIASQMRDAQHRELLEGMAREWERLASERASELAKAAKRAQRQTRRAGGYFRRARPSLYLVKG